MPLRNTEPALGNPVHTDNGPATAATSAPKARKNIPIALPMTGLEEWEATRECFESGWLTQGPKVAAFEKAFASYHGVNHAIAVTSCTTGLHLALAALGIGPGDEVIVPAFTWVATANVVLYCGATPVFVDVDPVTCNLDPARLSEKVTPKTKAVIVVHLFGRCADMDAIRAALPPEMILLEDAACAVGASYQGTMAGALGHAGVFSFHPRKIITTGEGGMVTTQDDALAERMRQLRNHGASVSEEERHHGPRPYLLPAFHHLGFNYRMTDLQGAVGLVQLGRLEILLSQREAMARRYDDALADMPWLQRPTFPISGRHGWQAYVCTVKPETAPMPRNALMETLQAQGISTRPGTHAVHTLDYYRNRFGFQPKDFPQAWACDQQTLALPLHNRLSTADQDVMIAALKRFE